MKRSNAERQHAYRVRERAKAIAFLGGTCSTCGTNDVAVLKFICKINRHKALAPYAGSVSEQTYKAVYDHPKQWKLMCGNCRAKELSDL